MDKVEANFLRDLRRQRIYPTRRKCGDITLTEDQSRLVFSCYECDLETHSIQNFLTHSLECHTLLDAEEITLVMGQITDDEEEACVGEHADRRPTAGDYIDEGELDIVKDEEEFETEDDTYSNTVFEKIEIEPAGIEEEPKHEEEREDNDTSLVDADKWAIEMLDQALRIDEAPEEKANVSDMEADPYAEESDHAEAHPEPDAEPGPELRPLVEAKVDKLPKLAEKSYTKIDLIMPEDKVAASQFDPVKMLGKSKEDLPKTLVIVDDNGTTYICGLCDRSFKLRERYKLHVRRHMGIRPYACEYCDATFVDASNWGTHTKRHLNIKPHICEYCSKGFISTTELKHHVRSHTGERPFKCTECERAFKTSTLLNKHFRRHTNERPYVCSTCGKQFFDTTHLKDHELTHTKIKSHGCQKCDAKFARRKALLQHMKLHAAVKQYSCKLCNKTFAQGPGLYSHMKTHRKAGDELPE